jgi:hypothetical protein
MDQVVVRERQVPGRTNPGEAVMLSAVSQLQVLCATCDKSIAIMPRHKHKFTYPETQLKHVLHAS